MGDDPHPSHPRSNAKEHIATLSGTLGFPSTLFSLREDVVTP